VEAAGQLQEAMRENITIQAVCDRLRSEGEELQRKSTLQQESWESQLHRLEADRDRDLERMRTELRFARDSLPPLRPEPDHRDHRATSDLQAELESERRRGSFQVEVWAAEKAKLQAEWGTLEERLKSELRLAQVSHQAELAEARRDLQASVSQLRLHLELEEERREQTEARHKQECKLEMAGLRAQHDLQQERLRSELACATEARRRAGAGVSEALPRHHSVDAILTAHSEDPVGQRKREAHTPQSRAKQAPSPIGLPALEIEQRLKSPMADLRHSAPDLLRPIGSARSQTPDRAEKQTPSPSLARSPDHSEQAQPHYTVSDDAAADAWKRRLHVQLEALAQWKPGQTSLRTEPQPSGLGGRRPQSAAGRRLEPTKGSRLSSLARPSSAVRSGNPPGMPAPLPRPPNE